MTATPAAPVADPPAHPAQRRILTVLVAAQVLSGAGLAAGITVGALLAQDMLGATSLAGLPSALFTIGSAAAAVAVGRLSQHRGRRSGLAAGYAVGAAGALGVVAAAVLDSPVLLFSALFVYGAGTATNLQARYAGADLAAPARRGQAVSTVLVATTLGAVAGPNLVEPLGRLATAVGVPPLAGPFLLAALAYGTAAGVLWLFLHPDPLVTARAQASAQANQDSPESAAGSLSGGARSALLLGALVMVLVQLVMVAVMTMTPVHMQHHGHSVGAAGFVIAVHVGAMYLPSPLSGFLVDRWGPAPVVVASGITLLAAGLLAGLGPAESGGVLALALGLLGLGWSLGLVAGTAMVTNAAPLATRAKTQGVVDVAVAVAGAGGGLASGLVVASTSFTVLSVGGGVLALGLLPAVLLAVRPRTGDHATAAGD
ncbi:MFS transporter [Lipingzhangella sp. LS1_29]|uniref:MFS transporter n=1 Tax=Lipingzhangella rawalii TaxID=2055835 RepID=A0ABU2H353_9ACTN|nr:MFS transporter [Lipingzhangella rawalii]MDS1269059.1 MFS transporter [Lipingzhangella rawalii]